MAGHEVRRVLKVMDQLGVSLLDIETFGYVEAREEDLTTTIEDAFDQLIEDGFNFWEQDSHNAEHWYQAGADMVHDALDARGLLIEEEY
jgi:hypothetical protein